MDQSLNPAYRPAIPVGTGCGRGSASFEKSSLAGKTPVRKSGAGLGSELSFQELVWQEGMVK